MRTNFFLSLMLALGLCIGLQTPAMAAETSWMDAVSSSTQTFPAFNLKVLKIAHTYPTDGTHDYWWPRAGESSYDGSSEDVFVNGKLVMKGEPEKRTFCCGLTMEVFLKAYQEVLDETGQASKIPDDKWSEFKRLWFVEKVNGPGPSAALEKFGLGREVPMEEALPGDFVQIWRRWDKSKKKNGSGHSVIFLDWVRNESGEITGMKYFSTQTSTSGISVNTESFGGPDDSSGIAKEFTTYSRVEL